MHNHHEVGTVDSSSLLGLGILIGCLILPYLIAVYASNKKKRKWPLYRIVLWSAGVVCISLSILGPVAKMAHTSFQAHMATHLLLGMLGPLLLVFSAPMTLLVRTLPVRFARKVSKFLKSTYIQFVSHPITASILNIGGLWILYTTDLFNLMHSSTVLYIFIHFHVFLAGYIFTVSMINVDLSPRRTSFQLRAVVLVLAMAGHSILSKWIYANPPVGIEQADAKVGAMLMYYGGDLIDLIIVIAVCAQYFKLKQPEPVLLKA
ncbi:cytochrome c oxidase assembly protein [Lysinibacillus sp. BW-2-10]|uniref:cytochrome c oxidase assembly protein n=1 Tax=Lysinibacillus sp. BW-2-10 TaxID=2590030 RepID=UPI00117C36F9|nr:cytochrome c oxidase assembly protein [Lysinibacillus sp. BW-2-10]TSI04498.1 cytochrome c oxidase assembly protein [Lysinibacillus sp. BW-2-10]